MEKTLSSQATNWREGGRLRAWELHQKGWKQQAIAEALGVTQGAVSQWLKRAQDGGVAGLRHRPPLGQRHASLQNNEANCWNSWPRERKLSASKGMSGPSLEWPP